MSSTKLFKYFAGKSVNVIMRSVKGAQVLGEGMIAEGNVVIEGILLDEDDHFFYLGTTDDAIDDALLKTDLVRIFIEEHEDDEYEEIEIDGERH